MMTVRSFRDFRRSHYFTLALATLIVICASGVRLYNLIPAERGLSAAQDYDEGVWNTTAQLWLQGYMPYRDFFATVPPVGIYLLGGVLRSVYVPWGSGLGLMATRYVSAMYGILTVALVCWLGVKIGGRATGLVAAGLLALDAMVVGTDRLAMLEPPLNLFSVLAVWAYLQASEQASGDGRRGQRAVLAGLFSALAALSKTPGLVVLLALITVSLLRRRWRQAAIIAMSFLVTWLAVCAPFLLRCPAQFLKQVYVFQLLRPADGVLNRFARLFDMWRNAGGWLTIRLGIVGGLGIAVAVCRRRDVPQWCVVLAWAGYTLLLTLANRSYYPQYYVQLAVPLSFLAGGLVDARVGDLAVGRLGAMVPRGLAQRAGQLVLTGVLAAGAITGSLEGQYLDIRRVVDRLEPTYTRIADVLRERSAPDERVLVFEPNYTFLASRSPAGVQAGRFLVDSYGEMLYMNLGVESLSLAQVAQRVLAGSSPQLQATFWARPAQDSVLAAFESAELVVVDGRARYQLKPSTLLAVQNRSAELASFGVAAVRRRQQ